jgi:hypothetical protein
MQTHAVDEAAAVVAVQESQVTAGEAGLLMCSTNVQQFGSWIPLVRNAHLRRQI